MLKHNVFLHLTALAFFADSENKTPLFPMMPMGYPNIRANPQEKTHTQKLHFSGGFLFATEAYYTLFNLRSTREWE